MNECLLSIFVAKLNKNTYNYVLFQLLKLESEMFYAVEISWSLF